MKPYLLFLSLTSGALGGLLQRGNGCNADNCARAVTGTRFAPDVQASHTADCSSFMIQTITPATPTTTLTLTPTIYSVVGFVTVRDVDSPYVPAIAARQVTQNPVNVPIYASACSGTVRYSSACSCAGITQTTTYARTPATFTSTSYAPASTVPVCDPNQNYGFQYDSVRVNGGTQPIFTPQGEIGEQACCAACYQPGSDCILAFFSNNQCSLVSLDVTPNTPTDYCPNGRYGNEFFPFDGLKSYGLGPCGFRTN